MRSKVLQLIGSFHSGGSERQALQLASSLAVEGSFDIRLATLNQEGPLRAQAGSMGFDAIPEFPLTSFYDRNFIAQVRKFTRFLQDEDIAIVQTHDFYTNVFGLAAMKLAGVQVKIASKRETLGVRTPLQRCVERQMFRFADVVIANSGRVKDFVAGEGVSAHKIEVIHNGLDLSRFKKQTRERQADLRRHGINLDERKKLITMVANLRHDVKDHPMLIRAAKLVCNEDEDVHFLLVGDGELRSGLQQMAQELNVADRVHFVGESDSIPELLSSSFAGVLTSRHEGFSNSILEYMAAGLPVVATDVGGASEAISHGETGFLVASEDHEALAERLMELLASPDRSREMGEKGRDRAGEHFSIEAQRDKTLALYNKKLGERR
ncbi:MAG TPA: glycosyltransferase [Pyrinomonadaceae bacterium]|nr:glycosyltransferase [Pyrinomonadaceae bacterium]